MVVIKTAAFITKHNKQELKMSESIRQKVRKQIMHFGLAFCTAIAVVFAMTGCSESGSSEGAAPSGKAKGASDNSTPAKYFRYTKEGNVMDGEYIVIRGLNTKCDINGQLEVNLDEIWTKYQGKIIIPSTINGVPVKAVDMNVPRGQQLPGGIVSLDGKIQDPDSLYLGNSSKWDGMITEVIVPDNVTSFGTDVELPKLTQITVSTTIQSLSPKCGNKQPVRVCFTGTSTAKPNFKKYKFDYRWRNNVTFVFPETIKEIDISSIEYHEFCHDSKGYSPSLICHVKDYEVNVNKVHFDIECAQDAEFTWGNGDIILEDGTKKTLSFAGKKYGNIDELLTDLICDGILVKIHSVNGKETVISSKTDALKQMLDDFVKKIDWQFDSKNYKFDKVLAPEVKKIFK